MPGLDEATPYLLSVRQIEDIGHASLVEVSAKHASASPTEEGEFCKAFDSEQLLAVLDRLGLFATDISSVLHTYNAGATTSVLVLLSLQSLMNEGFERL